MALCHDRVRELAFRPVTPMSVNSPGPIADLAASVTEIKRGLRQGQGASKWTADARPRCSLTVIRAPARTG